MGGRSGTVLGSQGGISGDFCFLMNEALSGSRLSDVQAEFSGLARKI